jgi:hypothetical protein
MDESTLNSVNDLAKPRAFVARSGAELRAYFEAEIDKARVPTERGKPRIEKKDLFGDLGDDEELVDVPAPPTDGLKTPRKQPGASAFQFARFAASSLPAIFVT